MMDIYGTVERAKEKIEEITDFAVGLYEEESMVAKIKMNYVVSHADTRLSALCR